MKYGFAVTLFFVYFIINNENRARKIDNMDKRTTYGGDQIDPKKLE